MATIRAASNIRMRYFRMIYLAMKINVTLCSVISTVSCIWFCIDWKVYYDSNCYIKPEYFVRIAHASGITQTVMLMWCTFGLISTYCLLLHILKKDFPGMKQTKKNL